MYLNKIYKLPDSPARNVDGSSILITTPLDLEVVLFEIVLLPSLPRGISVSISVPGLSCVLTAWSKRSEKE